MQGIYCIQNTVNGKRYIGSSRNLENRFSHHRTKLNQQSHHNIHLQRAWDSYGEANFVFIVLEELSNNDDLIARELYYIERFDCCIPKTGYNVALPDRFNTTFRRSEETRRKMSQAKKGIKMSAESRLKMSLAAMGNKKRLGKSHSEETRRKLRGNKNALGAVKSEETRRKISEANKGNKNALGIIRSEETRRKLSEARRRWSDKSRLT